MKNAREISATQIQNFQNKFAQDEKLGALALAASSSPLLSVAYDPIAAGKMKYHFAVDIPTMEATNQKNSGRCWIFAALNVFREIIGKNCNIKTFELSENYVAFWDKFEKINYFLESVIDTAEREVDERTVSWILQNALSDGGQWDMIVSLVNKYGVVPMESMPETHLSSNTRVMNQMILMRLREHAAMMRTMIADGKNAAAYKDDVLKEMYDALIICFGRPPQTIDFEYTDKDKNYHVERNLTPKAFYDKYINLCLDDYVSIINAPTQDKPYGKLYTVKYLGNVIGGKEIAYINVDMETLKELIIAQLKDDEVVWFGSDVSKFGNREKGVWDKASFGFEKILNMPFGITKEQQLDYRDSLMTHAMVITGVNFDESGKADRWKIQNSWGKEKAFDGYHVMGAEWFDQYVYQAVIHKKHLSDDLLISLKDAPIELEPWDPMGALAYCH